jgi:hypothetical protein
MAPYEWIAAAYFLGLGLAAWTRTVPRRRRIRASAAALAMALAVIAVSRTGTDSLRAWAPHAYLVAGYWLPALLAVAPLGVTRFEQWLVRRDAGFERMLAAIPRTLRQVTELAYLLCYPLIPAAFAVVWLRGDSLDVTRFWVAVLVAGYSCYASLPWLVSRPPRLREQETVTANHVGAINVFVLRRVSHELNTFPSGHVAVSCAAAALLAPASPATALAFGIVATLIAVGAVAGRYHYVVDVVFACAVAVVAIGLGMLL